jgi:hypothetical protein
MSPSIKHYLYSDDEDCGFWLTSHEQSKDATRTSKRRKSRVQGMLKSLQPKLPKKETGEVSVAGSKKKDRT